MNVLLVACGHNLRKVLAWLRARLLFAWILSMLERRFGGNNMAAPLQVASKPA